MTKNNSLKEWRVHLGAHKTATTHIQDTLATIRDQLAVVGIEYIPREEMRMHGGIQSSHPCKKQSLLTRIFKNRVRTDHWIEHYATKQDILLVSEENLLGSVSGLLTTPVYPEMEKNLRLLSTLNGDRKIQLFLAIRGFDTLLPSAYGQQARMGKAQPGTFDAVKRLIQNNPPRWSHVVDRIVRIFGTGQLTIWKYEDYKSNHETLLALLCAKRLTSFPFVPPPPSTKSPSAEAIAYLEKISLSLPKNRKKQTAAQVCLEDTGTTVYQPFSQPEINILQEVYSEDLLFLERTYPGVIMTFPVDKPVVARKEQADTRGDKACLQ